MQIDLASILSFTEKHKIKLTLGGGLLIGLILGLVIGYVLLPVQWVDQSPGYLRGDYREPYLLMVADQYEQSGRNIGVAQDLLGLDLPYGNPWLKDSAALYEALDAAAAKYPDRALILKEMQTLLFDPTSSGKLAPLAIPKEPTPPNPWFTVCGLGLLVVIVIALILFVYVRLSNRPGAPKSAAAGAYGVPVITEPTQEMIDAGETTPPVTAFTASYVLGDDYFDPSFSIEVGPDFLGECGVGVSEAIGIGDPKKVTAFEVWLFDKSDIRTVTTVLASDYAYTDPTLRSKLAPKGEVVKIQPGTEIVLETTALRIRASVKAAEYAQGNLPPNSFFQKVSIELRAWVRQS